MTFVNLWRVTLRKIYASKCNCDAIWIGSGDIPGQYPTPFAEPALCCLGSPQVEDCFRTISLVGSLQLEGIAWNDEMRIPSHGTIAAIAIPHLDCCVGISERSSNISAVASDCVRERAHATITRTAEAEAFQRIKALMVRSYELLTTARPPFSFFLTSI